MYFGYILVDVTGVCSEEESIVSEEYVGEFNSGDWFQFLRRAVSFLDVFEHCSHKKDKQIW